MVAIVHPEHSEGFSGDIGIADASRFNDGPYVIALLEKNEEIKLS